MRMEEMQFLGITRKKADRSARGNNAEEDDPLKFKEKTASDRKKD